MLQGDGRFRFFDSETAVCRRFLTSRSDARACADERKAASFSCSRAAGERERGRDLTAGKRSRLASRDTERSCCTLASRDSAEAACGFEESATTRNCLKCTTVAHLSASLLQTASCITHVHADSNADGDLRVWTSETAFVSRRGVQMQNEANTALLQHGTHSQIALKMPESWRR